MESKSHDEVNDTRQAESINDWWVLFKVQAIVDGDAASLVAAVRAVGASLLVLPARPELVESAVLRQLRDKRDCPVCLVRCPEAGVNERD